MIPGSRFLLGLLALALAVPGAAADVPRPQEVMLPVKDYLALIEKGEAAEKERRRRDASREAPVAEVTSQRVRVVLGDKDMAEVTADYEVLVQGVPKGPVVLPVTGVPRDALVKSGAAALSASARAGEWLLVAPAPGRYTVEISGPVPMSGGGVSRLILAPAAAPVSITEVDLPADLSWSAPGTVVVEDKVVGARRAVRLTSRRGQAQTFEVRRKVDGEDAEKLIVQSQVLTLVQLRPDGPRRHDVVVYEVSRGGLDSFTVDLPPGLAVETVGTDEGEVVPAIESRRLTVQRRQQLRGVGYLVLTSTPQVSGGAGLALPPVVTAVAPQHVRGRFLALSSSIAAEVNPLPSASWSRIDLDDLPPVLREALGGVDLSAAWRLAGKSVEDLGMTVAAMPATPVLSALASLRETTTLITLDGTLLHRDRITLRPAAIGTALDLTLPAGATLWSARVDDVAVRPLERGGGKISVPLGFDAGRDAVVEVVSVQPKAIPAGRSELALDVPRLALPVQQHLWRLLLPDGAQYRFRSGDLKPVVVRLAPRGGAVSNSRITVSADEPGEQSRSFGPGTTATLHGRVADDKGSPLPGVTVTLQPAGGQPPVVQVTNAQGSFRFLAMPPGSSMFKAELEGYDSIEVPTLQLVGGQSTSLDIRLAPAVEDVITVTAEAPLLDERRVSTGANYEPDEVTERGGGRQESAAKSAVEPPYYDFDAFEELRKGLVGGVKPLPIAIPESGKLLLLTGVLPPEKIGVTIEVKGSKEKRGWF
jgi:hypothetical protein